MFDDATTSPQHTVLLRDAFVTFWVVLWATVGFLTALQVWSLSTVRDAAFASARAADTAGRGLQEISRLPLVPDGPGELGEQVRSAARETRASASQIEEDLRQLALLLGVAVALVPSAPLLAGYLPDRLRRVRAARVVREELDTQGRSAALDAYLAHQLVTRLTLEELRAVSADPVGDVVRGDHAPLADEHLRRLGLDPARRPAPGRP